MKVKIEVQLTDYQVNELLAYGAQRGFGYDGPALKKRERKRRVREILAGKISEVLLTAREEKEATEPENQARVEGG